MPTPRDHTIIMIVIIIITIIIIIIYYYHRYSYMEGDLKTDLSATVSRQLSRQDTHFSMASSHHLHSFILMAFTLIEFEANTQNFSPFP